MPSCASNCLLLLSNNRPTLSLPLSPHPILHKGLGHEVSTPVRSVSRFHAQRQPRSFHDGDVDHFAVDGDDAAILLLRLAKSRQDLFGVGYFARRRRKLAIDDLQLLGWIANLPLNPNWRAMRHSFARPSSSFRSEKTVSMAAILAAPAAKATAERGYARSCPSRVRAVPRSSVKSSAPNRRPQPFAKPSPRHKHAVPQGRSQTGS